MKKGKNPNRYGSHNHIIILQNLQNILNKALCRYLRAGHEAHWRSTAQHVQDGGSYPQHHQHRKTKKVFDSNMPLQCYCLTHYLDYSSKDLFTAGCSQTTTMQHGHLPQEPGNSLRNPRTLSKADFIAGLSAQAFALAFVQVIVLLSDNTTGCKAQAQGKRTYPTLMRRWEGREV